MAKKYKLIPVFKTAAAEREFWEKEATDSTEYLNWSKAQPAVFPHLRPTTTAISLRLPEAMLAQIKSRAHRLDVPYQSLMKLWLDEKLHQENKLPVN